MGIGSDILTLNKVNQINDNTKFLYNTALDGGETTDSVGEKVAEDNASINRIYSKTILADTAVLNVRTDSDSTVYDTADLTVSVPAGATIVKIILCVQCTGWVEDGSAGIPANDMYMEYRKDSGGWTTVQISTAPGYSTTDFDPNGMSSGGFCKIDLTATLSDYSSTIGVGLGISGDNGQSAYWQICGSAWYEIYYSL